ncbi:MAG: nitroreductase family protein, partial [Deltaproteobacteria bacterium]|nr:nitroreductase family protein [Deltaproteobacteria bacterium]
PGRRRHRQGHAAALDEIGLDDVVPARVWSRGRNVKSRLLVGKDGFWLAAVRPASCRGRGLLRIIMEYDRLMGLLGERRSCRSFSGEPVTDNQIRQIIAAGQLAPSPLNLQPWSFIVITGAEVKKQIRQAGEAAKQAVLDQGGPGWAGGFSIDFIESAPLILAVLHDPGKSGLGNYFGQPGGSLQAASACIQNLMLAATSLNLGSLWFTFFDPAAVAGILGVEAPLQLAGLLFLGRPAGALPLSKRRPAQVYQETFGIDFPVV